MDVLSQWMTTATGRIHSLPIVVLMPHSRCNCRCVMCDIWKSNHEKRELSEDTLASHLEDFKKLGLREVTLSGGEALLHSNLWRFCELLESIGVKITLLSTGLTIKHHAEAIIRHCCELIVSLDGSPAVHNAIRNIPNAFEKLDEGVKALKAINADFRVKGRCVLQKHNFHDFANIVHAAHSIGLDQLSFLPADVSSTAFNRAEGWDDQKISEVALSMMEAEEFEKILRSSFVEFESDYRQKFIAENPQQMIQFPQYYRAMNGHSTFPRKKCNAPWVSAVVESNGDVLPCFFHPPYGNIHKSPFKQIINGPAAISFRRKLNVNKNSICEKCVCSLYRSPWRIK